MRHTVQTASQINRNDCHFYHSISLPNGEELVGDWDIRKTFDDYIGGVDVKGKTVLDVGTASGVIAFEVEKRGALRVTAQDLQTGLLAPRVPFQESLYYNDYPAWVRQFDDHLVRLHNSFLYAHHKLSSRVNPVLGDIKDLPSLTEKHDIVIAGAIIEHFCDPVSAIGHISKMAKETIILASTPVVFEDRMMLCPINAFDDARHDYTWYQPSIGLLKRLFANLGFRLSRVTYSQQHAVFNHEWVERPTIVATRVR